MAIGDSITAALLAKGEGWAIHWDGAVSKKRDRRSQQPFTPCEYRQLWMDLTAVEIEEYRGVSYAIGGDEGAITLPAILGHYSNVTGPSTGHRPPVTCSIPGASRMCIPHDKEDRFNAAISGSTADALVSQVRGA